MDKTAEHVSDQDDLLELADQRGELTVDAFEIDPNMAQRFRAMFDNVAVRLIARGVSDQRLVVQVGDG